MKPYYKVVTANGKSLGLRKNPTILKYPLNEWIFSPTVTYDNADSGGIWCCEKLHQARKLKKYYEERYGSAKIFECNVGNILFQNSYRTKTDKVYLTKEIIE